MVWRSGINPLMLSREAGMAPLVAIIMAADEESPSAQVAPSPR